MIRPYDNLPERWKERLRKYVVEELDRDNGRLLGASDFRDSLSITFEDGSYALFHGALYLIDREANEVAVFTEHCGYHIFPLGGTTLELK